MITTPSTRREFLAQVGQGALVATVGYELANGLGLSTALAADAPSPEALDFGPLESLVRLMQDTPADKLLPELTAKLNSGTDLRTLVAAGALANARSFGGEDYVGYHTLMALAPAFHISSEMSDQERALPILKVLYRNTNQIQVRGGHDAEVLHAVQPAPIPDGTAPGDALRNAMLAKDKLAAEQLFASLVGEKGAHAEDAFNALLHMVHDHTEVHRVVLPYRAWDLIGIVGREQAHALLRQSVRYCVTAESWGGGDYNEPRDLLPKILDEHKLNSREPGDRKAEDQWIDNLAMTIFRATPQEAAAAAAFAIAEGMAPGDIGEAITLAANQLVLRDIGRPPSQEVNGKPPGSVHGDSIGVHACDSANAWRNMARVGNPRNAIASLVLGAYQVARDRIGRGGDFLNWEPLPIKRHLEEIKDTDGPRLLKTAEEAIRGNLQAHAAASIHRYCELGNDPAAAFTLLRGFAVSEDGALHAEKFYRTVSEEFQASRPAHRARHLVALARVTASEYGRPAPGMAEARELLGV
jgi:hypothetical protein